jgi:uncharacterized protein YndB with AHSA1/START domain
MPAKNSPTTTDEIVISRVFDAPRELVFQAWTDPVHLAQWWGPRGFTNPVCEWSARPGAKVHVVMRAPNGTDYPMAGAFREVVAPEKLVFTTGALDAAGQLMFEFLHILEFVAQGDKTKLTLRSRLVATTPGSERYTNGFKAGMSQSWEKLAELADELKARTVTSTRRLAAAPASVFQAFAQPQVLAQWWGPAGFTNRIDEFDLRPGGRWRIVMRAPNGTEYPNESEFLAVMPSARLVFLHLGPLHRYVMMMTFAPEGAGTRLTWHMLFDTAAECAKLAALIETANQENFDRLAGVLK